MTYQVNSVADLPKDVSIIASDTAKISLRLQNIVELVVATQQEIEQAHDAVEEIAQRGLLKKMFSNNTRDLALAQGRLTRIVQSITEIQQYTLAFMMGLIQIHHQSLEMLAFLRDAVSQTKDDLQETLPLHQGHTSQIQSVQNTLDQVADVIEQKIADEKQRRVREAAEKQATEARLQAEIDQLSKRQDPGSGKWLILGFFILAGLLGGAYIIATTLRK